MKVLIVAVTLFAVSQAQFGIEWNKLPDLFNFGTKAPGTVCKTSEECGDGECCVEDIFGQAALLGKRQLIWPFTKQQGVCKPYRKEGSACHPLHETHLQSSMYKGMYQFSCPCDPTLVCKGEKVQQTFGFVIHTNPTCQVDTETGSGKPDTDKPEEDF
ncbi:uncharacterized protein LOC106153936 [Lingula anatina]|uniref:Uncharacterized protein LOC106153936 n=1 Tax=Lingula anatina TaxID=7574 RepID=A0A1S3HET1_LINAN|nr:uncharacterized protein LOC106153936 [Lingula anatina]|eukprot:XP_013383544.1 uncharacterized protein LOC106153936 [Lingula anatina]